MDKKIIEERLIMLFVLLFFIFLFFYKPANQINKFDSAIKVITDSKNELIIKENNITKKVDKRCTHNGCLVKYDKTNGKLICPCHDSEFSLDGKVLKGPASKDLAVTVTESYTNCKLYDW